VSTFWGDAFYVGVIRRRCSNVCVDSGVLLIVDGVKIEEN